MPGGFSRENTITWTGESDQHWTHVRKCNWTWRGWITPIVFAKIIAAAASEPEANEPGSSLISRRLHYRGFQSLFLTKRKELWLCANGRFRMRSGMRKELWLCANGNILGCAVIWRKELWLCANGWFRMRSEPCAFLPRFSLFAYILQILTRVSKRL